MRKVKFLLKRLACLDFKGLDKLSKQTEQARQSMIELGKAMGKANKPFACYVLGHRMVSRTSNIAGEHYCTRLGCDHTTPAIKWDKWDKK